MSKPVKYFICIFAFLLCDLNQINSQNLKGLPKSVTIENFDNGSITLTSYPGEDINPSAWQLNSTVTYQASPYSLRLFGNTWKMQSISGINIEENTVWQVAAYIQSESELQAFGISDGSNVLLYAFAGSEEVGFDNWVTVYQGAFEQSQWNIYQLPVADDWYANFGYLPTISSLIYVNDNDASSPGVIYFDLIKDISQDLPIAPNVSVEFSKGNIYNSNGLKLIDIQFNATVYDPDSQNHTFFWNFGDGSFSNLEDPAHTFTVTDDHPYTVLLTVEDPDGRIGRAVCNIEIDPGNSSFPVTLNFIGDVMLARNYEYPGGIIPTLGVNAIFEPTKSLLGDAADITIANLECPLTTAFEHHPTKQIYFKSNPDNATGLTFAGIDIVTIANNHIYDYLYPGLSQTMQVLDNQNIMHSGAGIDSYQAYKPLFYSIKGVNFAFLASSDRTGQYNNAQPFLNAGYNKPGFANLDPYYYSEQLNEVSDYADLVIAEWHTGTEYSFNPLKSNSNFISLNQTDEDYEPFSFAPSKNDIELRHLAIDLGTDLLICHHPHIIQGLEVYKGKLIAHSLGNFAFDLAYPETFPSMILYASADKDKFLEFSISPVYIDDFIPKPASGELGTHILNYIAECSRVLNTVVQVDPENITAKVILDPVNMISEEIQITDSCTFSQSGSFWVSQPLRLKRIGSLARINQIQSQLSCNFRLGRQIIWFGNMEDEGCSLWNLNSANETWCDTTSFSGNRSLQHIRLDNSPDNIVTDLEKTILCIDPTLKYSLIGYLRTQNAKNVTVEVQYFSDRTGYNLLGTQTIGTLIDGNTPWTLYHRELTIPPGTNFFNIRLVSDVPDFGTAYSWFDNIGMICWDSWNEYQIGSSIPAPNDFYFLQLRSDQNPENVIVNYSEMSFRENMVDIYEPGQITPDLNHTSICSPNPFNPENSELSVSLYLNCQSDLEFMVSDIQGSSVFNTVQKNCPQGHQTIKWNGLDNTGNKVNSGIYFYHFRASDQSGYGKCILIRNDQ